jgi:hypothetical protein
MVNFTDDLAIPEEMHPYDPPIDDPTWLKNMDMLKYPTGLLRPDAIAPTPMVVSSVVTTPTQVQTILGNGLTNSQKWAWVIGLTFGAWALLYWSGKKSN